MQFLATFALLAVAANTVAAGPVRYEDTLRHLRIARSLGASNSTLITPASRTGGQVGSVAAQPQNPDATTTPTLPVTTKLSRIPSTTLFTPAPFTELAASITTYSRLFSLGTGTTPLGSSTVVPLSVTGAASAIATATSATGIYVNQTQLSTASPSTQTIVAAPTDTLVSSLSTTATTTLSPAASTTQPLLTSTATSTNANVAMALEYNAIFTTLTPDSSCNPDSNNQKTACVQGQLAQCGTDRKYALTACPAGEMCYALPLPANSTGVFIQCDTEVDATSRLGLGIASNTTATATSMVPSTTLTTSTTVLTTTSSVTLQSTVTAVLTSSGQTSTPVASIIGQDSTATDQQLSTAIAQQSDTPTTTMSQQPATTTIADGQQPVTTATDYPESTAPNSEAPQITTSSEAVFSLSFPTTPSATPTAVSTLVTPLPESSPAVTATQPAPTPSSDPGQGVTQTIPNSTIQTVPPVATSSYPLPAITIIPVGPNGIVTVTETVTVTTTVHDGAAGPSTAYN